MELVKKKVVIRFGKAKKGSIFAAAKQESSNAVWGAKVHYKVGLQGIKKNF